MASNAQKTPLALSLNDVARERAGAAIHKTGRALPCSIVSKQGSIVRVKFEINSRYPLPDVTIPHFGPEYVRYPTQPGDKGIVLPADYYIGGMSGLGGGAADLTQRGNLSNLVFFPIANTSWSSVDANAVTIYGPNGVVLRDSGSACVITLTPSGITIHGNVVVTGSITTTGDVVAAGHSLDNHVHGGVMGGGSNTSGPIG